VDIILVQKVLVVQTFAEKGLIAEKNHLTEGKYRGMFEVYIIFFVTNFDCAGESIAEPFLPTNP
jgi:hypothetical protein